MYSTKIFAQQKSVCVQFGSSALHKKRLRIYRKVVRKLVVDDLFNSFFFLKCQNLGLINNIQIFSPRMDVFTHRRIFFTSAVCSLTPRYDSNQGVWLCGVQFDSPVWFQPILAC